MKVFIFLKVQDQQKYWNLLDEREAEILALGLEACGGGSEEAGGRPEQQVVVQHFHLFDWRFAGPRVGLRRLGLKWATAPANCPAALCSFLALELRLLAVDDSGLSNGGRLSRRPSAQDGSYLGRFPSCGSHANQVCGAAAAGNQRAAPRASWPWAPTRGARSPKVDLGVLPAALLLRSPPPAGGAWWDWYENDTLRRVRILTLHLGCVQTSFVIFTASFLLCKHMAHEAFKIFYDTHTHLSASDVWSILCESAPQALETRKIFALIKINENVWLFKIKSKKWNKNPFLHFF